VKAHVTGGEHIVKIENAMKVGSIKEEYEHIKEQRCDCGGSYERHSQALFFDDDRIPHDQITVSCRSCGKKREFWFDCSEFFGKY
jgi:hypothetical protein